MIRPDKPINEYLSKQNICKIFKFYSLLFVHVKYPLYIRNTKKKLCLGRLNLLQLLQNLLLFE
jgi:hypothetical protein